MEVNQETPETNGQADLLNDESYIINQFEYATQWQRFFNYLIDNVLMRYGLSYLSGMAIGGLLAIVAPDFLNELAYRGNVLTGDLILIGLLVYILNYTFYYTFCEKLFKGYTLGKLVTGTRAIRQDGKELTFKDALLRSLSRLAPFEVFSGFNTLTWHDNWTDTMVVKAR